MLGASWRSVHALPLVGGTPQQQTSFLVGGITVALMGFAALAAVDSRPRASSPSNDVPTGCQPHVELRSAAVYAKELGGLESGIEENYTIKLWSSLGNDRWKTGEMRPGRRAVIRAQDEYGFLVVTSDGTEGWVSNFQVSRTLRQDTGSQRPCR
jgi:hypothetical protein